MKSYDSSSSFDWVPDYPSELIRQYQKASKTRRNQVLSQGIGWIWNTLLRPLTTGHEPRITEHQDHQGNRYFQVYDPTSGRSLHFSSEQEVRAWLDQRYYQ